MSCDAVPWCTIDHERILGGDWEATAEGDLVRYHEHGPGPGALVYLLVEERFGADGVTLSAPRVSVNGEDEQLELPDARVLADHLLRLAAIADGVA